MGLIYSRGKRTDGLGWVEGVAIMDKEGHYYICDPVQDVRRTFEGVSYPKITTMLMTEVEPDTVDRMLNRSDVRGKILYQNDIVKVWGRGTDLDGDPLCIAAVIDEHTLIKDNYGYWFPQDTVVVKVIGNFHDNPELLEVK